MRVFNPFVPSLVNSPITPLYHQKEQEKRRAYDERIRELEHGSCAPLIFLASGGMGPSATGTVVFKRIVSLIATKQKSYPLTISYIICRLAFSLLQSAIMSLRGHRGIYHQPPAHINTLEVAVSEGRLQAD